MKMIEIYVENEKEEKDYLNSGIGFLFYLCGVLGFLFFLLALNGMIRHILMMIAFTILFCGSVWYTHIRKPPFMKWFYLLYLLSNLLVFLFWGAKIRLEWTYIWNSIMTRQSGEPMTVMVGLIVLISLIALLLFWIEFVLCKYMALYVTANILIFLGASIGLRENIGAIIFLAVFQILCLFMCGILGYSRKKMEYSGSSRGLIKKGSIAMAGILSAVSVLAVLFVVPNIGKWYDAVYQAEGFVWRSLGKISGSSGQLISNGRVGRGNNYQIGEEHLEVIVSQKPEEVLYLKGFTGAVYQNDLWEEADDEPLIEQAALQLEWDEWIEYTKYMYHDMTYALNMSMGESEASEMRILPADQNSSIWLVPYNSHWDWRQSEEEGYSYSYFEQQDMHIDYTELKEQQTFVEWYQMLEEVYADSAAEHYLEVPQDKIPRIVELIEGNQLADLDQITAFIVDTLHSNASYSLTPGLVPLNQDTLEYFLFGRRSGYCVHFASVATLMYRLYGIPARYATGYVVEGSAFELQPDGTYHAAVTDESAHAWVEIYIDHYGWTPVEVTPSGVRADIPDSVGAPIELPSFLERDSEDFQNYQAQTAAEEETLPETTIAQPAGVSVTAGMTSILLIFYLLLLLLLIYDCWLIKKRRQLTAGSVRNLYSTWLRMLHFGGILKEYDGMDEQFWDLLPEKMNFLTAAEAGKVYEIVCQAAYGSEELGAVEKRYIQAIYRKTANEVYGTLSWRKKLVFCYVKVFEWVG